MKFDLIAHLKRQKEFSKKTWGPTTNPAGVIHHIRKELTEIEKAPNDLEEWVDVILLAFDGCWRTGHEAEAVAEMIEAKQAKNEARDWPDWRTVDTTKAIEHVKNSDIARAADNAADDAEYAYNEFLSQIADALVENHGVDREEADTYVEMNCDMFAEEFAEDVPAHEVAQLDFETWNNQ